MVEVLEPEGVEKIHKAQTEAKKGPVSLAELAKGTRRTTATVWRLSQQVIGSNPTGGSREFASVARKMS